MMHVNVLAESIENDMEADIPVRRRRCNTAWCFLVDFYWPVRSNFNLSVLLFTANRFLYYVI